MVAKWIHELQPFPLGEPTRKVKRIPKNIKPGDRAFDKQEKQRLLVAADLLVQQGGRSRDRHRYRDLGKRPQHKGYRPYRDRAIIYTFFGTGLRRAAVAGLTLLNLDRPNRTITYIKKGGATHTCKISREALAAIEDYEQHERVLDAPHFPNSDALFLPASTRTNSSGQLSPRMLNYIYDRIAAFAGVVGHRLHDTRHTTAKELLDKTNNPKLAQVQLGHDNIATTLEYLEPTLAELEEAVNKE